MTVLNNRDYQLMIALRKLKEAAHEITVLWETDEEYNIILEENYPFEKSFDELTFDIDTWSTEAQMALAKKK